jgi:hypothetical protein
MDSHPFVDARSILIAQGYDPLAAMELIKEKRPQADPYAFYIRPRILKFAREWGKNHPR